MISSYECFVVSLRSLVNLHGHGIQARLAEALNKSRKHINDVLKGRAQAGTKTQEAIAHFFGYSLEEMMTLGRDALDDNSKLGPGMVPNAGLSDSLDRYAMKIERKVDAKLSRIRTDLLLELKRMEDNFKKALKGNCSTPRGR